MARVLLDPLVLIALRAKRFCLALTVIAEHGLWRSDGIGGMSRGSQSKLKSAGSRDYNLRLDKESQMALLPSIG